MAELETRLLVQVSPNAARNAVEGFRGKVVRVRIAAPPVQGKANKELIAFLSEVLKVGKSDIRILKGHTLRNKMLGVKNLTQEEMTERLIKAAA